MADDDNKEEPSTSGSDPQKKPPEVPRTKRPRPTARGRGPGVRPHLESVNENGGDEDRERTRTTSEEEDGSSAGGSGCPDYFGVRSYLHHFYESMQVKDPDLYEDLSHESEKVVVDQDADNFRYLVNPKRHRCVSIWWKVGVWCGLNLIVLGSIAILVGYLVPQRPVVVGAVTDDLRIIDRAAVKFNTNLDACKLAGLVIFCAGGGLLAISLLFPSLLHRYQDDVDGGRTTSEPFGLRVHPSPPRSPIDIMVPATERLSHVQPSSPFKSKEALTAP